MKPECDIILLSYESPVLLKKCVQSVLDHTCITARLIIVDNASSDPKVRRYLNEIHGRDTLPIEKVFSESNAGFAGGMNKGMRLADAPFVCILNNDCIVTDGWLKEMIAIARSKDNIGLVNPQSNTFGSCPDDGATINEHAALIRYRRGKFVELGHAIGFACLIKKELVEMIGFLDEEYKGVCYEDTDFSVRAQRAGFVSVMAEGAYVFHAEQASRKDLKGKEEIYRKNKELFENRWGRILRCLYLDRSYDNALKKGEKYEMLKNLARQRTFVDMWVRTDYNESEDMPLYERCRSGKHADISVRSFSGKLIAFRILWKVLTKKKKYDAVITEKGFLLWLLRFLKPFHGAEIFSFKDESRVISGTGAEYDLNVPSVLAQDLRKAGK